MNRDPSIWRHNNTEVRERNPIWSAAAVNEHGVSEGPGDLTGGSVQLKPERERVERARARQRENLALHHPTTPKYESLVFRPSLSLRLGGLLAGRVLRVFC